MNFYNFTDESEYKRPERHFIYPKYDVFDKEISQGVNVEKHVHELFNDMMVDSIIAQSDQKPVEYLTSHEKMGVYVGAGVPMKWENGKISTIYDVAISLIDGKYKVSYKIPKINNTYC